VSFWRSCESNHKVDEILELSRWHVVIKQGQFDSDPDLLGVRNGVVDLRTGTLRPATRQDFITKQSNVTFDSSAPCPLWEKFLLETTARNHELIAYLQQCVGIKLTGIPIYICSSSLSASLAQANRRSVKPSSTSGVITPSVSILTLRHP
jgi:D5-like protein